MISCFLVLNRMKVRSFEGSISLNIVWKVKLCFVLYQDRITNEILLNYQNSKRSNFLLCLPSPDQPADLSIQNTGLWYDCPKLIWLEFPRNWPLLFLSQLCAGLTSSMFPQLLSTFFLIVLLSIFSYVILKRKEVFKLKPNKLIFSSN